MFQTSRQILFNINVSITDETERILRNGSTAGFYICINSFLFKYAFYIINKLVQQGRDSRVILARVEELYLVKSF